MKKLIGFLACAAMVTSGAVLANEGQYSKDKQNQSTSSQSSSSSSKDQTDNMGNRTDQGSQGSMDQGTGGSPTGQSQTGSSTGQTGSSTGQTGSSMGSSSTSESNVGQQELTGEVVKADRKTLYIDHMGAIVSLKVDKNTQFPSGVKRASELKPGQQVRASFTVKNQTENLATSVQLASQGTGAGGSGFDQDLNKGGSGTTGGSGTMDQNQKLPSGSGDVNQPGGTGGSGDMNQPGGTGGSGDQSQNPVDQSGQPGSQSGSSSGSSSGGSGY